MTLSKTFWLILGTSEYQALTQTDALPGVNGATESCQGLAADVRAFGYPTEAVMALCGEKFLRAEVGAQVRSLDGRISSGDTIVVVIEGHGGMDPVNDPGNVYWQPFDGSFLTEPDDAGNAYVFAGITPQTLEAALRKAVPDGTAIVFLTDTARGGTFQGLSLAGPAADDFAGLHSATLAYSPKKGSGQSGLLRRMVNTCLQRDTADGADGYITLSESEMCLPAGAEQSGISLTASTHMSFDGNRPLVWFPPKPAEAIDLTGVKVPQKTSVARSVQRWAGLGVGVASATAGTITYFQAKSILDEVEEQNYVLDPSMKTEVDSYEPLVVTTYVLWGIGALGAASFGTSFLRFQPAPDGFVVSGTF